MNLGWRPKIPKPFRISYPKFTKLLKECWRGVPSERPTFDEIVRRLNGEVADEVRRNPEPDITLLHLQSDAVYWEDIEGEEEEEEGKEGEGGEDAKLKAKYAELERLQAATMKENEALMKKLSTMRGGEGGEGGGVEEGKEEVDEAEGKRTVRVISVYP
jgi:hypothetical protein